MHAQNLRSLGIRTEVLSPSEVKHLYPELNTDDIEVGTLGPDDGPFDPHMIMWGYMKRAAEKGVKLYQGEKACGLKVENGRVIGVETRQRFYRDRHGRQRSRSVGTGSGELGQPPYPAHKQGPHNRHDRPPARHPARQALRGG